MKSNDTSSMKLNLHRPNTHFEPNIHIILSIQASRPRGTAHRTQEDVSKLRTPISSTRFRLRTTQFISVISSPPRDSSIRLLSSLNPLRIFSSSSHPFPISTEFEEMSDSN
ncbi:hypothetical protein Droror1_Dr00000725 [Drosera rotundifolia]